ncbi:MAG: hypothetical protein WBO44_10160 [Saprospiraceae bacterium]
MLKRIQSGWTFIRFIYLIFGGYIVVESILDHQWLGLALGIYFASMGLFGFGCASGNCFGAMSQPETNRDSKDLIEEIQYDEVKGK